MPPLTLSPTEWSLVQHIEAGSVFNPQPEDGKKPEIRAQALIDITLGKYVAPPANLRKSEEDGWAQNGETPHTEAERAPRAVSLCSAGIRFSNARITGELDLQDASGPGGSMLPRLRMENCDFAKPIRLQRSRLRSLSVKGSCFPMLDLSNAHIGGRVDLSGVRGIEPADSEGYYGQCWVIMVSTRVEGLVTARYARFVAPARRPEFVQLSWFANYALDLRGADITGSVMLRPRCRARGGISVTLANIQGSVWASGAEVTAGEEASFSAAYAVIRGSIYLRPYDPSDEGVVSKPTRSVLDIDTDLEGELALPPLVKCEQFRAVGRVSFFACKLGGSLYMEGASFRKRQELQNRPADQEDVVDVRNAEIAGDAHFCAWQSRTRLTDVHRFESEMEVDLDAARIRNELTFRGASVPSVSAKNIQVGGDADFCAAVSKEKPEPIRFMCKGNVEITSAQIGGDLLFCGASIGEEKLGDATDPSSGEETLPKNVGLSLAGSTIGGSCFLNAFTYRLDESKEQRGLRFECYGLVRFSKARITRSLRMDGARIQAKAQGDRATLDLAGSIIGGDAYLRTWHASDASQSHRFEATGGRVVIRLNGTRIGQNLIMNGSRLEAKPDPVAPDQDLARSVYALSAVNATIGGKADLSTFLGKENGNNAYLRFESIGLVSFAMATVSLGVDMEGAELRKWVAPIPAASPQLSATSGSTLTDIKYEGTGELALDLSDAHVKFVRLGRDQGSKAFSVAGDLNLDRTRADAEVDLVQAEVEGALSASVAKVGANLRLNGTRFSGAVKLDSADIEGNLELEGTTVCASLRAYGIRIGNSVILVGTVLPTGWFERATDEAAKAEPSDPHKRRRRVAGQHVTRVHDADISFKNGRVGHTFQVNDLRVPSASPSGPDQTLPPHSTVDLRGLHIGELDDSGGSGWTTKVRLWLDGFRYDRLPEVSGSPKQLASFRKQWLALQYFDPKRPNKREYSPDAYEHLASGLRTIGADRVAQKIMSERLRLEYQSDLLWRFFGLLFDYGYSAPRAIFVFAACILAGWGAVWWLDTQPYYPAQTATTRIESEAAGAHLNTIGSPIAQNTREASKAVQEDPQPGESSRDQTILVLAMSTPEARYSYEKRQVFLVEPEASSHNHQDLVPCRNRIVTLLYAMDVFLPVLNLHQEESCSIRPEARGWRVAQAFYAMLGWIITPLTILTFSGILRRHLEK